MFFLLWKGDEVVDNTRLLRQLPAVHDLVRECLGDEPEGAPPAHILTIAAREIIEEYRQKTMTTGQAPPPFPVLMEAVQNLAARQMRLDLQPVINATGVVLHTNLGRAPLCRSACQAVEAVARGYSNLELDLDQGGRGLRYNHVARLLRELTGAEAAIVVNNNAAAVLLTLQVLAKGREVIVSRGEMVEVGGSFRIPDVMVQSGAILKEVGATNKTYPRDYERAISPDTALLFKAHPSNYRVVGFTRQVECVELVSIGRTHQIPVVQDLGSGVLVDLSEYGCDYEPTVQSSLEAGVDLVTFSGDKLLGGPQAGVIVGRADLIDLIAESPLLRALRVDKMTLAALEATLREYWLHQERQSLPVLRMLSLTDSELQVRAADLKERLSAVLQDRCDISLLPGTSQVGGGALPLTDLRTTLVGLRPRENSATSLAERLRQGTPPVLVRLQEETVLLDPRTIDKTEIEALVGSVKKSLLLPRVSEEGQ
jgi:L-seryl-tRNA(Ser) seleniumtransferase